MVSPDLCDFCGVPATEGGILCTPCRELDTHLDALELLALSELILQTEGD